MRVAAIDVGTNTVRMLAVEFTDDSVNILDEFGDVTRLGASLIHTGKIDREDAEKTLAVLETCLNRSKEASVESVDVVGTEVFRAADNGRDIGAEFSSRIGHALRILTAEDEAEAAYLGVVGWGDLSDPGPTIVVDVGGGSTQVISGEGIAMNRSRSVPIGSLRLTEGYLKHDPPRSTEMDAARKAAAKLLKPLGGFGGGSRVRPRVVGVGGTVCALGGWIHRIVPFDPGQVEGVVVSLDALSSALREMEALDSSGRMKRGGLSEGRARVVTGGGIVLECLLQLLSLQSLEVSNRGIRHGLVLRRALLA